MFSANRKRKKLLLGGLVVALISLSFGFSVAFNSGTAEAAPSCYNNATRRATSRAVTNSYPRPNMGLFTSGCNYASNAEQYVLLSSYYHNGSGAPGSTLHTPNLDLRVMYRGVPGSAVTIQITRGSGRCSWTSANDVVVTHNGSEMGALDSATSVSFNIPASGFVSAPQYGNGVYVYNGTIRVSANNFTSISCPVKAGALAPSGVMLTVREDASPTVAHSVPGFSGCGVAGQQQRFNQQCASTGAGAKRILGPPSNPSGSSALWNNIEPKRTMEYALPFQLPCNVNTAQTVSIRYYDPDSPHGSNPSGTSQPNGNMGLAVYDESSGALVADWTITDGNDTYGERRITLQPNRIYTMSWYNVYSSNGIQYWLPYSDVPTRSDITCNRPPTGELVSVTCVANTTNTTITVTVTGRDPDYPGSAVYKRISSNNGATWSNMQTGNTFTLTGSFNTTYTYRAQVRDITDTTRWVNTTPVSRSVTCPGNPNPIGFIDSCYFDGKYTIVLGWSYDTNSAAGPTTQVRIGSGPVQNATTNIAGYRVADINNYLNTNRYGTGARDNAYGWRAYFEGATSAQAITGTVINAGAGTANHTMASRTVGSCARANQPITCTVLGLSSNPLNPGDSFTARFRITNNGSQPVQVSPAPSTTERVHRMGMANNPSDLSWGVNRTAIPSNGTTTVGARGVLRAGTSVETPTLSFTVPGTIGTGTQPFNYRVLEEGREYPVGSPRQVTICGASITIKSNNPVLRVEGSDVISGSNFGQAAEGCSVYSSNGRNSAGTADISARGNIDYTVSGGFGPHTFNNGQSSSQYAAYASGFIGVQSDFSSRFGSGNLYVRDGRSDMAFANINGASGWYGELYDSTGVPCFDISVIQARAQAVGTTSISNNLATVVTGSGSSNFVTVNPSGGTLNLSGTLNVPAGKRLIVIVNGNVNISGNINYPSSYANVNAIPYLMVIARGGNMNIGSGTSAVTIDGHYLSLPNESGTGGRIDTCPANAGAGVWPGRVGTRMTNTSCRNQLTINGSLIAKQILWKRTFGTTGNNAAASDPQCAIGQGASATNIHARDRQCAAEVVDFSSEAYYTNPLSTFSQPVNSTPNLTIERPPVY